MCVSPPCVLLCLSLKGHAVAVAADVACRGFCAVADNEDAAELRETLGGIANNIDEFVRQSQLPDKERGACCCKTRTRRRVTWRDIAVVIVTDGIIGGAEIGQGHKGRVIPSPSFRTELKVGVLLPAPLRRRRDPLSRSCPHVQRMGLWHDALIKRTLPRKDGDGRPVDDAREKGKDPTAIIFERTVMLPKSESEFHEPMQLIYAGKVNNGGKLSSHDLFFNGFCRIASPDYVFLVDVGTVPEPKSIVRLHNAMEGDENVGGCCGDITGSALPHSPPPPPHPPNSFARLNRSAVLVRACLRDCGARPAGQGPQRSPPALSLPCPFLVLPASAACPFPAAVGALAQLHRAVALLLACPSAEILVQRTWCCTVPSRVTWRGRRLPQPPPQLHRALAHLGI